MTEQQKYYISLGVGYNQIPLIQAAKKRDFQVIGIDQNLNALGFSHCDIKIQESITNYRKVHYKINMQMFNGEIAGGFSAGFSNALISWSFLAERYNLFGLGRTQTESLLDKLYIRKRIDQFLKINPIFKQPKFSQIENPISASKLNKISYPLIIKPRFGYGKQNVFYADVFNRVKHILSRKYLKEKKLHYNNLLIENFIDGDEITITGFVQKFKFHLISLSDKITSPDAPFIELEHIYPSKYEQLIPQLEDIHQKIVIELDIPSCPIVSEWKIKNGEFYLIEISPQIPGEFIPNFLIPNGLRYDYFDNLVSLTTGKEVEPIKKLKKPKNVRIKYFPHKIPNNEWEDLQQKAIFAKILNENPQNPPQSNADRFGVMGFLE